MRILIDCDVLLDVALKRAPHFAHSGPLLDWAERHPGKAGVAWHTLANLFYLTSASSRDFIRDLLGFVEVAATDTDAMRFALGLAMKDLEDAMQVAAAERFGAQLIATRNGKDFRQSPIQALAPQEVLDVLSGG